MRVSRKISIYRAQRSQQGCSLSLGMLRLAEPPTGRARLRSSLKSPRNPITPIETTRVATLDPELYENLREDARRVIGATAKPLYPIDGKGEGLDRRSPRPPSSREGDRPQTVEGVLRRWKAFIPIVFMPNILLFSDARQAYEAYEAYEAQEPIFLKKDRLFLIGNFINRRFF